MAGINLTKTRARLNTIKNKLYHGKDGNQGVLLRLLNVNDVVLEMNKNWYMPIGLATVFGSGTEFFNLYIADVDDNIDLSEIMPFANIAEINGERYKVFQYFRPRGLTKQWELRLQSTGEQR